jgi:tetratricopeptide (TPR) repeat protein
MDVKPGILEAVARAHAAEQNLLASLSDEERAAAGTAAHWSARALLTHLVVWKQRLTRGLVALVSGSEPVTYLDLEAENASIFDEHRDLAWPDLHAALAQAQMGLVERVKALGVDELLNTRRFAGQNGQPHWRMIVMNGYWHPMLHLAQFYYDRGRPDWLNDDVESVAVHLRALDPTLAWQGRMVYDLACYYSLSRQRDKAVLRLREALRLDPALADWARKDTDLAPLRGEPGYEALYKK